MASDYSSEKFTFAINKVMKTAKPGKHQQPIEYYSYQENDKVCVVSCLRECIRRTKLIRENTECQPIQLRLSYAYLHKPVMSTAIARYVKLFLGQAGTDLTVFTAQPTWRASTSKENNLELTLDDIRKAGGWTTSSTFRKHYKLPIHKNLENTLLNGHKHVVRYTVNGTFLNVVFLY